jgi:hypothetical protein
LVFINNHNFWFLCSAPRGGWHPSGRLRLWRVVAIIKALRESHLLLSGIFSCLTTVILDACVAHLPITDSGGEPMRIGAWNHFEVGSTCEALSVGDNNVFEAKCALPLDLEHYFLPCL